MNEPKDDTDFSLKANESPTPEKDAPSDSDVADSKLLDALEEPEHIRLIVREAILLAGGAVAILLQVAEPGVGKGVDNHSNFDYRPMDRLRTTMTYVYCMAFGSREEKKTVTEMVHHAHASVRGDGYSADDPELQLWVAATLYAVGTMSTSESLARCRRRQRKRSTGNTRFSPSPFACGPGCGHPAEKRFGSTGTGRSRVWRSMTMQEMSPRIYSTTRNCLSTFAQLFHSCASRRLRCFHRAFARALD